MNRVKEIKQEASASVKHRGGKKRPYSRNRENYCRTQVKQVEGKDSNGKGGQG